MSRSHCCGSKAVQDIFDQDSLSCRRLLAGVFCRVYCVDWGVLGDSAGHSQQLVASGSWVWLIVPQAGAVVWGLTTSNWTGSGRTEGLH